MTKTSNVKADFVQPIVVLTLICLVMSLALAYLNSVTKPIIEETEAQIAEAARSEVLPDAGGFTKIEVELPATYEDGHETFVTEVYEANNGSGYVFMGTGNGYGGKGTMRLAVSLDSEGNIINTMTLAHSETPGMGSRTADEPWRSQFTGVNGSTLSGVDTITGATISSNHYLNSIESVFDASAYIAK